MKTLSKTLFLSLFTFCTDVNAQMLSFNPEKPKPGQEINFSYQATGKADLLPAADAIVFSYESMFEEPVQSRVNLTESNGLYTGRIQTTLQTKAITVSLLTGEEENEIAEVILIHDNTGQPVQGALAMQAYITSMQFIHTGTGIVADEQKANTYLQEEFKRYPGSRDEYIGLYAHFARVIPNEAAHKEIEGRIKSLLSKKTLSEDQLIQIRMAQFQLGHTEAGFATEALTMRKYPNGKTFKAKMVEQFYCEVDPYNREYVFNEIQHLLPAEKRSQMCMELAIDFVLVDRKKSELYRSQINNPNHLAYAYNSAAWKLSGESIDNPPPDLKMADYYSSKAMEMIKNNMGNLSGRPFGYAPSAWENELNNRYGFFAETNALIQFKLGNYKEAYDYQVIFNQHGFPDAESNERFAAYTEKVKGKKAALLLMADFIASGSSTKRINDQFVLLLASFSPEEAALMSRTMLQKQARAKLKSETEEKMIDRIAPSFTLRDLNGNLVSLDSLRGITVVLDFWATWCGPCLYSFPDMQEIVDSYRDNPSVRFYFIDTWEKVPLNEKTEKVKKLIQQKGYRFEVLMDGDDQIARKYNVGGIPAKYVIGPDGRLKFERPMSMGNDRWREELELMIELAQESAAPYSETVVRNK